MKKKISKTKIEKRLRKKRNPFLVGALIKLKKKNPEIARLLARPVKKWGRANLEKINKCTKEGESIFFPGKILGSGNLDKKVKIVAWGASEKAKEKMKRIGAEFVCVLDELKKNLELKDLRLLK